MQITVQYFAVIRELVGRQSETRQVPEGSSGADLIAMLSTDYPTIELATRTAMLMVNQEYVRPDHLLSDGDEVALIPPVSGGSTDPSRFRVTDQVIDLDEIVAQVSDPGAGAIVTFAGTVRDNARGRDVLYLDYEAYPAAAEKMLARIGDEIAEHWGIERVAIVHRTGKLAVGETSVAIAVASPHRGEAFDACRHAIERIKQIVPIWKKEFYADGDTWIGSEAEYQAAFGHSTNPASS